MTCYFSESNNTHQITIDDVVIDIVRKKIKNLYLRVCLFDGKVKITSPLKLSDEKIKNFALSKLTWIQKKKEKIVGLKFQAPIKYVSGELHYFQGKQYILNIISDLNKNKVIIDNHSTIHLWVKNNNLEYRKMVLMKWYKAQFEEIFLPLIEKWGKIMNVKINACRVRHMKTKWGCCHIGAKKIVLNVELVKKPLHCLEYVIVHELVHLQERLHNKKFEAHMDRWMPAWRIYRDKLNGC